MSKSEKLKMISEFCKPQVIKFSDLEISQRKADYIQAVASLALEGAEPDDFGKVVSMEAVRGELTTEEELDIIEEKYPKETQRIQAKMQRMRELGLTWKDL